MGFRDRVKGKMRRETPNKQTRRRPACSSRWPPQVAVCCSSRRRTTDHLRGSSWLLILYQKNQEPRAKSSGLLPVRIRGDLVVGLVAVEEGLDITIDVLGRGRLD